MKKVVILIGMFLLLSASICVPEQRISVEDLKFFLKPDHIEFITKEEGYRQNAYYDSRGFLTIGIGHLIKPFEHHLKYRTLSHEEILRLFRTDISACDDAIHETIPSNLTNYQYEALYSFCFNIGADNFKRSTVIRKLRNHDIHGAADALLLWNKPSILAERRKRERDLFLHGAQIASNMH